MGPGPFACTVLADLGADVLRIDRPTAGAVDMGLAPRFDVLGRGRRSAVLDLKEAGATETLLGLVASADVLVEGYRPGVMERLGLGPDACLTRNPRLVYCRVTGWGQQGPMRDAAGHDINYIALAGALDPIGRAGAPPTPPLSLVGDFGGGGMLAVVGVLAALHERTGSGEGQVVDAAMVDGAALLTTLFQGLSQAGAWASERGTNSLDSGAPFYDAYETADGKFVSVGPIEPKFYLDLLTRLGLDPQDLPQGDRARWPEGKKTLADVFRTRTRKEWCDLLEGTDTCFAPVLSMAEAPDHPHNRERGAFVDIEGVVQPAPAPRFSRTPASTPTAPPVPGEHTPALLNPWPEAVSVGDG
jgi:alpha-methylacyl-CoA racemase